MNERPVKDFSIGKAQVRVLVTGEQTGKRYAVTESHYLYPIPGYFSQDSNGIVI